MKKIIFSIFTLALATMVGCQKSEAPEISKGKQVTVTATIAGAGDSRVALTPSTDGEGNPIVKVAWKDSGEQFKVLDSSTGQSEIFTQTESNNFSGTFPESQHNEYSASYPVSNKITPGYGMTESYPTYDVTLFTEQDGKLSEERTVMSGYYDKNNNTFEFSHLTILLCPKFKVGDDIIPTENIKNILFKDMLINQTTADFNIDCTSLQSGDNIYVYLPNNNLAKMYGNNPGYEYMYKTSIEMIVKTDDAKTYEGVINIKYNPSQVFLSNGKLYTATVSLTPVVSTNVITYTTTDNQQIVLDNMIWSADNYLSHTFENGIGEITLKDGITAIPYFGFQYLSTLKTVIIPTQVTSISEYAFRQCTGLIEVIMPSVTTVGEHAFNMEGITANNNLQTVDLSNVRVFGVKAFYECHISSANLSSATEIGEKAFAITNLTSITMPKQDCTLGNYGFARIPIQEIDLSAFTSLGGQALHHSESLKTVIIDRETPPTFGFVDGSYNIFNECTALESIYVPDTKVDTYKAIDNLSMHTEKIKPISEKP